MSAQTDTVVSKTVTVDYILNVPNYQNLIDGFPIKSFVITNCRQIITFNGKIVYKGKFDNDIWQRDTDPNPGFYPFKDMVKIKPGMIIRIDNIHVIRRPWATGEIEIPSALEFIITE